MVVKDFYPMNLIRIEKDTIGRFVVFIEVLRPGKLLTAPSNLIHQIHKKIYGNRLLPMEF